ncbi:transposase [Catellatospora sp. KI3]|uniref:IS701 family transposase n=1 Tax=Catellatospora sp. KI3 TaxID=3041620 RepID=UPI0024830038|nr:transposase [Catellatospora sp. KI3]MDI1466104.1 transposase [Catellatospora sp. KI3]
MNQYRSEAAASVGLAASQVFDAVMCQVACRFTRIEPRLVARDFVRALLMTVDRKNCWQLAEVAGHARPSRMQRLLREAVWDAESVAADERRLVTDQLAHPDAVLGVDETGFLKKGACSAGVQRQHCGTAGRVENSQVAVILAYASPRGRALVGRRLYMPTKSWTADTDRCRRAGIPDGLEFATKPALAGQMIDAAIVAGIRVGYRPGDQAPDHRAAPPATRGKASAALVLLAAPTPGSRTDQPLPPSRRPTGDQSTTVTAVNPKSSPTMDRGLVDQSHGALVHQPRPCFQPFPGSVGGAGAIREPSSKRR